MCSVGDDIEENETSKLMPGKLILNLSEIICLKCRSEPPVVVLQGKYSYCRHCFVAATVHKFKALLGKNRVIQFDDKVLIWHRTGHASTALLHFLRSGLDLTTPKRIRFIPIIIFIEDHYSLPVHERRRILQEIDKEIKHFKFPSYYLSLCEYLSDSNKLDSIIHNDIENISISESDLSTVKSAFGKKPTKTVEKEWLKIYQHQILTEVAKHLKCSGVFIPDIGIDIASQFLTSISMGRGAHTVYDIGTIDTRDQEIKILRPLRNFTIKELGFYNHFHNLEPVTYVLPEENPYSSVQSLMDKFVSDLQVNYPATVSTIVRTGDKLTTDKAVECNEKCLLCRVPIENHLTRLQSTEATNFSHWISTQGPNNSIPIEDRTEQLIEDFSNTYGTKYCFSCNRISEFLL